MFLKICHKFNSAIKGENVDAIKNVNLQPIGDSKQKLKYLLL
jgi:hypothetical protein